MSIVQIFCKGAITLIKYSIKPGLLLYFIFFLNVETSLAQNAIETKAQELFQTGERYFNANPPSMQGYRKAIDNYQAAISMYQSMEGHELDRASCYLRIGALLQTFGEWQDVPPGHFQMDLVGHDGGITTGQCCFTLTMTDVCLGWTERRAVLNRAARWVLLALQDMQEDVPFEIEELHPDNGSEFINQTLVRYCKEMAIALTRSRASRKNDNCYVEQKNFDAVRKLVGYARFTTPETVDLLNTLYKAQGIRRGRRTDDDEKIAGIRCGLHSVLPV